MQLTTGTTLKNSEYRIDAFIGQGGFGITYKGTWFTDVKGPLGAIRAQLPVAIKEFFFEDYCSRNDDTRSITIHSTTGKDLFSRFKEKLKKEADILSGLIHPNIVKVLEVFEENNTAYMVMDYIEGEPLKEVLARENKLTIPVAVDYIKQIAGALAQVHQKNILHLDVKPGNIIIAKRDGRPMLIDFGISKRYDASNGETSTTPLGRSKGYAPIEQYFDGGAAAFSPSLDVYALGATLYHCVTGQVPVEANERVVTELKAPSALHAGVPAFLDKVILKAMELRKEARYQTIAAFAKDLDPEESDRTEIFASPPAPATAATASEIVAAVQQPPVATPPATTPPVSPEPLSGNTTASTDPVTPQKRNRATWLIAAGVIALLGFATWFFWLRPPPEPAVPEPVANIENDSTFNRLLQNFKNDTTYANWNKLYDFTMTHTGYAGRLNGMQAPVYKPQTAQPQPVTLEEMKDNRDNNPAGTEIFDELKTSKNVTKKPAATDAQKKIQALKKEREQNPYGTSIYDSFLKVTEPKKVVSKKKTSLDSLRLDD